MKERAGTGARADEVGGQGGRREHGNIYFTRDTSPTEISRPGDETLSQMSLIVRFLIVILDLDRKLRLRR